MKAITFRLKQTNKTFKWSKQELKKKIETTLRGRGGELENHAIKGLLLQFNKEEHAKLNSKQFSITANFQEEKANSIVRKSKWEAAFLCFSSPHFVSFPYTYSATFPQSTLRLVPLLSKFKCFSFLYLWFWVFRLITPRTFFWTPGFYSQFHTFI